MSETDIRTKLEYAKKIEDPLRRRLYVCALVTEALPHSDGLPYVVVGGNALEFYTLGDYTTADVDLVSARRSEIGNILESWGFNRMGRHWYHADLDVAIEVPDDVLAGSEEKITQVEIEDLTVHIIGVEDLIIDRVNAYVHWRSIDDGDWAKELMVLYKDEIDWDYLATAAQTEKILDVLNTLKSAIEDETK
jgi:predicted nucleotidyltransferase